jgi:NAD-dependent deacetylase
VKEFNLQDWGFTRESKLVILTGAGISAESGIQTFRDSDGLWNNHSIEDVCTPGGYTRNRQLVLDFYNARREQLKEVDPNPAHVAIATLQQHLGNRCFLVTQNVDNLHERGGSTHVVHMHGQLDRLRCNGEHQHDFEFIESQSLDTKCPVCEAICRPHIVWFEEMPFHMEEITDRVKKCTHFVYIGTSSQVYPAAGLKSIARRHGAKVLCINLEIEKDYDTNYYLKGYAGIEVPKFVESIIGG